MNPSPTKLIVPRAGPDESRRATGPVEIVPAEQRRAVRIIVKGLGAEPGFRARVLAKVEAVLRRARVAPTTATVAFTSEKGSKGGVAIRCAVTAMVPRQPALRVAQVAVTPLIAFDQAVAALDRMLTGAPDRRRTLRRRPKKYYLARRAMEAS